MGLDFVEIIVELEETFEIEISDDDLSELDSYYGLTVADLFRVVQGKIENRLIDKADVRLNLNLWHDMRSLLHNVTAVPEEQIRLGTRLRDVLPLSRRTILWERMRSSADVVQFEPLVLPKLLRQGLGAMFWVGGFILPVWLAFQIAIPDWLLLLILFASPVLLTLWVAFLIAAYDWCLSVCWFCRWSLPDHLVTVKDLCRSARTGYATAWKGERGEPTDRVIEESWSRFVAILSEQLCIPLEDIQPESRLVQDLKMD